MPESSPSVVRVTAAIMAKPTGPVQRQLVEGYVSDPNSDKARPEHGYWLIPPEIYGPLNDEFRFDYDPCPNPRPEGYDGLTAAWGKRNWVNPPFWAGTTAWVRKAILERERGNLSVVIIPNDGWVCLLMRACLGPDWAKHPNIRPLGFHDWIHTKTGKRQKSPRPSILWILRPDGAS